MSSVIPRCSATCAYYTPFAKRPNLHVFLNSTVSRIIWSNTSHIRGVANEVEYISNNRTHRIPVEKEVILAAGTIGSPKVLELSGVGNETRVFLSFILYVAVSLIDL
jgi:choline dehydrogenase-like flavoprotein